MAPKELGHPSPKSSSQLACIWAASWRVYGIANACAFPGMSIPVWVLGDAGDDQSSPKSRQERRSLQIRELASKVDVLTAEIEHVDADALDAIGTANQSRLQIHPHPSTIKIIQDKLRQKEMLQFHKLPWHPFCSSRSDIIGEILINEIAPRPHNSGHYTIEACETSQYENHLALYWAASWSTELKIKLRPLLEALPNGSPEETNTYAPVSPGPGSGFPDAHPLVGIIMGSDSDLPVMLPAARILDHSKSLTNLQLFPHTHPDRLVEYSRGAASRGFESSLLEPAAQRISLVWRLL
ncbi:phosphoribosylaminoimidazole carboxylase ade [Salix suchowensis]|nr:phosphoribosylaminoimidazole carboxylase ade [Salix suchowensis]